LQTKINQEKSIDEGKTKAALYDLYSLTNKKLSFGGKCSLSLSLSTSRRHCH